MAQLFLVPLTGLFPGRRVDLRVVFVAICAVFTVNTEDCPLELHPPRVVVKYRDPVSVNCTVSTGHKGMGWAANPGGFDPTEGVQFVTWKVDSLTKWDVQPQCFVNFPDGSQCDRRLSVTVYKPPDSVSISSINLTDHMVEGRPYQLKCDITNITPVQNLTVKWLKGITSVSYKPEDVKYDETKTPVNMSRTLMITPSRADNGAEYRCVAELDLGDEGPQPPPKVQSGPLRITVLYRPFFHNSTAEILKIKRGMKGSLNCTAFGNPFPRYSWMGPDSQMVLGGPVLVSTTLLPGNYTCTASNSLGKESRQFTIEHIPQGPRTTFWVIVGIGAFVAVALILGYIVRRRSRRNAVI